MLRFLLNSKLFFLSLLLILSSCSLFVRKDYNDHSCLPLISKHLTSKGWSLVSEDSTELEFKIGDSFVPTFEYDGDKLEVQLYIKKRKDDYSVEVGNYGIYIELLFMKSRFNKISESLDSFIATNCK